MTSRPPAPALARRAAAALRSLALGLGLGLAVTSPARADEVHLQDGSLLEGTVLEETPALVRLAVQRGDDRVVVEVPRASIRWVRRLTAQDEVLLRDAEAALLAGDHARALAHLDALVAARPDDPRAHRERGFALLLANREAEAAVALERATALDPIDVEALLSLAAANERLGRRDPAIDAWRRVTRIGPRHTRAWRSLARALLARGGPRDRADALDALARAADEDPRDEGIVLERVDALCPAWAQLADATGADTAADAVAARGRAEARAVLEGHVARMPDALEPARRLARLLAGGGEWRAAAAQASRLAARPGVGPAERERLEADAALYAWRADGARAPAPPGADVGEAGVDAARAEARLALVLEAAPDDGRLLLASARAALRAGRLADAASRLERAVLAADAPLADVLLLQEVVDALGRTGPAADAPLLGPDVSVPKARRAVALAPWVVPAHEALARALARDGALEEAAEAWEAAALRADGEARARLERAALEARDAAARARRNTGT